MPAPVLRLDPKATPEVVDTKLPRPAYGVGGLGDVRNALPANPPAVALPLQAQPVAKASSQRTSIWDAPVLGDH
jgi:hypothetical protein